MIKIYDNLFSDDFLMQSLAFYFTGVSWQPCNIANRTTFPPDSPFVKGSHRLLGAGWENPEESPEIVKAPFDWVSTEILKGENLELYRIDCNLQSYMINGTSHHDTYIGDGKDRTLIFFPHYKWKEKWGGDFEVLDEYGNVTESIPVKPGRMIYFDSSVAHRGLGPTHKYIYRVSVAYRIKVID
jgi:hypothetical protein